MLKSFCYAACVLACCPPPAAALDSQGAYFIRGIGNQLCAAYNTARDTHHDAEYTDWLAGYLSAFNRWTTDVWNIEGSAGFDSALRYLDYDCHVNPSQSFASATENLIAFLYPNRQRSGTVASAPQSSAGSTNPPH